MAKYIKQDTIDDLVTLAQEVNTPDDFLDDELHDAVMCKARQEYDRLRGVVLMDKIQYLIDSGYTAKRIKKLIMDTVIE
jgi:hypothetical protein